MVSTLILIPKKKKSPNLICFEAIGSLVRVIRFSLVVTCHSFVFVFPHFEIYFLSII